MASFSFTDPEDVLKIEPLPLEFCGFASGWNSTGQPVYAMLLSPQGLEIDKAEPEDLFKLSLSPEALDALISSGQTAKLQIKAREDGTIN